MVVGEIGERGSDEDSFSHEYISHALHFIYLYYTHVSLFNNNKRRPNITCKPKVPTVEIAIEHKHTVHVLESNRQSYSNIRIVLQ